MNPSSLFRRFGRHVRLALLACVCASATLVATQPAGRHEADQAKQKWATISSRAQTAAKQPRQLAVSEHEINAYLALEATSQLPTGVVEPGISILGGGRVSGHAVVDLDVMKKGRTPSGMFDPFMLLSGRVPISALGTLTTADGTGRFVLESAAISGITVPKMLLQEVVSYYSRNASNPQGIDMDAPFALPAHIREIRVEQGQAVIVQ